MNTLTCQFAAAGLAWEKAAGHAHLAGDEREELEDWSWVPLALWGGPTPVDEAIERCRSVLDKTAGDRKATSTALFTMGKLEAMRGRFDEARKLIASSKSTLNEIALPIWMAGPLTQMAGWVEILAGDPAAAESILRPGVEALREIGELAWMSTVAAILAEAVYSQRRDDEAERFILVSEEGPAAKTSTPRACFAAYERRWWRGGANRSRRSDWVVRRWLSPNPPTSCSSGPSRLQAWPRS